MGQEIERAADLLGEAYAEGALSEESKNALLLAGNIGTEVGRSLGSDASASELLLVTVLVDDSSSIGTRAPQVREGHNVLIDAFSNDGTTEVLFHTRYFNRGILSPYRPLSEAVRLTAWNYSPDGNTPLYQQSVITLGSVIAKAKEQESCGRRVRTYTLILTDGSDTASARIGPDQVRAIVTDMLEFATNHIVAGMGIGDEEYFTRIFAAMGIPAHHVHNASSTAEAIRDTFRTIATNLQLAASSEASFLQLASGSGPGSS